MVRRRKDRDLLFKRFADAGDFLAKLLNDLFGTLKTKISAANNQDRRNRPRQEGAEQQGRRQDEDQLVLE